MWARSFGAIVAPELTKSTTHVVAHRDRRTSKVRQAARHSRIKIVTPDWLFQCFAKWERVDEAPYQIEIERETILSTDSLPHDQMPDALDFSDEEDPGTDAETPIPDEIPSDPVDGPPSNPLESPILPTNDDWADIDKELEEFMASGSDTDSGTEDELGDESDASFTATPDSRKRKRVQSANNSDAEDSDASTTANGGPNGSSTGSKLQRRKKQALDRNTSLSNVSMAATTKDSSSGLPSPDATGPEEQDVDDGFEDDLEAAMLAEMERAGDSELE